MSWIFFVIPILFGLLLWLLLFDNRKETPPLSPPPPPLEEGFKLGGKVGGGNMDPAKIMKQIIKPMEKQMNKVKDQMDKIENRLSEIPRKMDQTIKESEQKTTKQFTQLTKQMKQMIGKITHVLDSIIQYIVDIMKTIESFLACGVQKLMNLPQCWYYYALDMFGRLLYLPISFFCWVFSLQQEEEKVWNTLEELDQYVYDLTSGKLLGWGGDDDLFCPADPFDPKATYGPSGRSARSVNSTGIHLIHFPDSVLQKCYHCQVSSFPKPKDYF